MKKWSQIPPKRNVHCGFVMVTPQRHRDLQSLFQTTSTAWTQRDATGCTPLAKKQTGGPED
ncbi:hypothetical protein EYF80_004813 [Liparis tanakae]|uniref:Uncharacterized protein n=1 Tax=Liparis tanakae TaxID=230148 RepID=A0A4Z2J505_9TELE|nr:hypothetical protein EYF80_004813 [Liparis tanakae]